MLLRAQIILVFISIFLLFYIYWKKSLFSFIIGIFCAVVLLWISFPLLENIWRLIEIKNQNIGLNKRDLELSAVWDYSSSSLDSFLFGSGLGVVLAVLFLAGMNGGLCIICLPIICLKQV